jgi:hypothetical protein
MAERNGLALRRWLASADLFSDAAIPFGSRDSNRCGVRSSASLVCITFADHLLGLLFFGIIGSLRCANDDASIRFRALPSRLSLDKTGERVTEACLRATPDGFSPALRWPLST